MRITAAFLAFILLATTAFAQNTATKELYDLFDSEWKRGLKNSPERASLFGDLSQNDKWNDNSLSAIERRQGETKAGLEKLMKIDRSQLSKKDKLNYDLFKKQYEGAIERYKFKSYLTPLNQRGGNSNGKFLRAPTEVQQRQGL